MDNPNPLAVPLFVIVAPESIVNVEPDNTFILLAVHLKSIAPLSFISIWSSVLALKLVSPSVTIIGLPVVDKKSGGFVVRSSNL